MTWDELLAMADGLPAFTSHLREHLLLCREEMWSKDRLADAAHFMMHELHDDWRGAACYWRPDHAAIMRWQKERATR